MNEYPHYSDGTDVIVRIPMTGITYAGVVSRDSFRVSAYAYVYESATGNLKAVHKNNIIAAI